MRIFWRTALLITTFAALAGCDEKPNTTSTSVVTPPATPAAQPQDAYGSGFSTAFNAAANSEPSDPAASGIIAVNATAEPNAL